MDEPLVECDDPRCWCHELAEFLSLNKSVANATGAAKADDSPVEAK